MLDEGRVRELKAIYRCLNQGEEKISFAALIGAIVENVKIAGTSAGKRVMTQINDWLEED